MTILVTGGAGFIGSHTCVELLNAGYQVVVVDNLCNACRESIVRIEKITGKKVTFYQTDLLDKKALNEVFDQEKIDAVIHFAGLKAVGESVAKPLEYYYNNLTGDDEKSWMQEYCVQFICNCIWRSGICTDH